MRTNVVIFSKDRAAQLEACIRSFLVSCTDNKEQYSISVLYKASNEEFAAGYELCKTELEGYGIEWKAQRHDLSFKKDLLMLFRGKESTPLTMFLVDDILFREKFSFFDSEIESLVDNFFLLACSLRLDKNIVACYATSSPSAIPPFTKGNVWNWYGAQGDWGYPYSVDGNVYRTGDMLRKMTYAEYNSPNQFEASMNLTNSSTTGLGTPEKPTHMICYVERSKLVNIPANRVQDEYKNRVGNIMTPEEMNKKFLDGERIALSTVANLDNSTVHVEIPIAWEQKGQ